MDDAADCFGLSEILLGLNLRRRNYSNLTINVGNTLNKQTVTCAAVGNKLLTDEVLMMPVTIASTQISLPSGTKVSDTQTYHEIQVPAVQPLTERKMQQLIRGNIPITDVQKDHQVAFSDTSMFNCIQSVTFDIAYNTDENMLICAPTGSGKTLIAVLGILRELKHYKDVAEFKESPFKIVYVAPMKALAAQVVENLKERLSPLGITVREFTGDMHLYAEEIEDTDVLVTTPEKYDTVTRRNTGSTSLFQNVRLLIIDEVHLLHGDRGPVLEAIIARTFQLRETNHSRLRVIGLSATLPNYEEIAEFLHVKPRVGLFYFSWGFRPVPLTQTFIGTKFNRQKKHWDIQDEVCYAKVLSFIKRNQQVIVFVHSRASTVQTASFIESRAEKEDDIHLFRPTRSQLNDYAEDLKGSKMKKLKSLVCSGLGFHHAGMLREDRQKVEKLFADGIIKVLVSTATLAWGVNFPAHAVIIKGTSMYSASKGGRINIDLLDVQQMFGRAGRPQFDVTGEAVIIANQVDYNYYLSLLTWQIPIESQMIDSLSDHLNAEIVLGTVSSILEGIRWLKHTFLYICMRQRPRRYDVTNGDIDGRCRMLIVQTAAILYSARMIIFDEIIGSFLSTDIGRIASYTYIMHQTIRIISLGIADCTKLEKILELLSKAKEYEQVKQRTDEGQVLMKLNTRCRYLKNLIPLNKVTTLLQAHMERAEILDTALYLDQVYAVQNARRILRAVFDIAVARQLASVARSVLTLRKCLEHSCWPDDHPLCQMKNLDERYYYMVHERSTTLHELRAMKVGHLKKITNDVDTAKRILFWVQSLPLIKIEVTYYRLTPDLVRIELRVNPNFTWKKSVSKEEAEPFIAWVENPVTHVMYVPRQFNIHRGQAERDDVLLIEFNLTLNEADGSVPDHLLLRVESQHWLGIECEHRLERMELMRETGAFTTFSMVEHVDLSKYEEEQDDEPENWEASNAAQAKT